MGGSNATDKRTVRTALKPYPALPEGAGRGRGSAWGGLTATHALATGRAHCIRNPSRGGRDGATRLGACVNPGSETSVHDPPVVKLPRSPPTTHRSTRTCATTCTDGDHSQPMNLNYRSCHRPRPGVPTPFPRERRFHLITLDLFARDAVCQGRCACYCDAATAGKLSGCLLLTTRGRVFYGQRTDEATVATVQ